MSYLVSGFPKRVEDKLVSLWCETRDTWYEFIGLIGDENGFMVATRTESGDQYEFESEESYTMFLLRWS